MSDARVISRMVDKRGREFLAGKVMSGRADALVKEISRTGNYVTVRFGQGGGLRRSHPILLHVDDVAAIDYGGGADDV